MERKGQVLFDFHSLQEVRACNFGFVQSITKPKLHAFENECVLTNESGVTSSEKQNIIIRRKQNDISLMENQ
ncbi:hypothetical protein CEXT_169281 [Caerostris extrusa]|uniref:Uncharacterized protein n=1 Tax=Caerostris extrusa TaxID=172846 RepID=A0AAV4TKV9_CAEEX|nr:hypothetical protein CEXT_169281 [Caerostris extrusa]